MFLLELGFGFLGAGGQGTHLAAMHISNLFPQRKRTVLACYTGSFQASAFVFTLFQILTGAIPSLKLWTLFLAHGLFLLILTVVSFVAVQPPHSPRYNIGDRVMYTLASFSLKSLSFIRVDSSEDSKLQGQLELSVTSLAGNKAISFSSRSIVDKGISDDANTNTDTITNTTASASKNENSRVSREGSFSGISTSTPQSVMATASSKKAERQQELKQRKAWGQMMSKPYLYVMLFKAILLLSLQYFLAMIQLRLQQEGDTGLYTTLFNVIGSFFAIPLTLVITFCMDRNRHALSNNAALALVLTVLYNVAFIVVVYFKLPIALNIFSFFVWSSARYFFFTFFFSFVSTVFGFNTFGRMVGVASLLTSIVGFVTVPLLVEASLNTSALTVTWAMIALNIPFFLFVLHIRMVHES
eukprot:c12756_g1_i3.p1 GENE.c12756_g1_i3~~c12756_g1_i3.p1  ORF type:complete len:413 (+),score=105.01 c12756_g1_i3:288-1526(+)